MSLNWPSLEKLVSTLPNETYLFQPVAVETLGEFGPSTLDFISDLDRQIFLVTGEKRATEFLRQRGDKSDNMELLKTGLLSRATPT